MTPVWTIQLLGGLSARRQDEVLTHFASRKTASLLAFLACYRDSAHSRETLIELLWPETDPSTGRARLSTLLTFLRHHLEPPGMPAGAVVQTDRTCVRLNPDTLTTDVAEFQARLNRARQAPDEEARLAWLQQAIEVYKGDLLPGWFEEWVVSEQARLNEAYAQALYEWAKGLYQARALEAALAASRQALSVDPYREPTCRLQMQVYAALGQPGAAQQSYRSFAQRLQAELGVAPSAPTRMLAEQIQRDPQAVVRMSETAPAPRTPARSGSVTGRTAGEAGAVSASAAASETSVSLFLPVQLTRFFGREEQITSLCDLLTRSESRLITVTGPGGVGKTRLAIEVARRVGATFEGRVWFVDLAALHDGRLLPFALAHALHLTLAPQRDPLEQVVQKLQAGPSLLLLDNFEHLLKQEPIGIKNEEGLEGSTSTLLVRLLLERAPEVKVLATSRQPLHLGGEQELAVPSLPLPETGDHEGRLIVPSVALYVDRARAVRPDFALTENNAEVVASLCRKLEGMPLALEMAAAWAKTLPPAKMLERLEQQLDLLVSRRRDVPARQRSMRATLEWSYDLLDPPLQEVFAGLSVFRGGWTLEAAEALSTQTGSSASPDAILYPLAELTDRSLVILQESGRYRMLESIREYAEEQLAGSEKRSQIHRHHAAHFLALAEEAGRKLRSGEQAQWLARLTVEHDNLRAALAWFQAEGESESSLQLAAALSSFWQIACYLDEGRARLAEVLERTGAAGRTRLLARVLNGAGGLASMQGDYANARALNEQALTICRELGDRQGVAYGLLSLGYVAYSQGDNESARSLFEQALEALSELGDKQGVAVALHNLGTVVQDQGDYESARSLYERSLAIQKELADTWGVAYSLLNLGFVACSQGDYESARSLYERSLTILQGLGEPQGFGYLLEAYARLALAQGQPERAVRLLGAAEALRDAIDAPLPANMQTESDRYRAILREDLGEEAFQRETTCGLAMTLPQAIAYAQENTPA